MNGEINYFVGRSYDPEKKRKSILIPMQIKIKSFSMRVE
jgi:hypothetical protein